MHTNNSSHLKEAIRHTEEAVRAIDAKTIAQHVKEAKNMLLQLNQKSRKISIFRKVWNIWMMRCENLRIIARKAVDEALDNFYQAENK